MDTDTNGNQLVLSQVYRGGDICCKFDMILISNSQTRFKKDNYRLDITNRTSTYQILIQCIKKKLSSF